MKRFALLPFLLSLLFIAYSAFAASFYSAKVVVQENSKQTEIAAKKEGFKEVLIRVSGSADTLDLPEIQKNLPRVEQFINQVFYEEIDKQRVANFSYDSKKIFQLLKQAKANFWSEDRPQVLFWLLETNQNQIMWDSSNTNFIKEIRRAAVRRGLPMVIPLGDLEDLVRVTEKELLGNFVDNIKSASTRYQPTGVVIAKIGNDSLNWQFFPNIDQMGESAPIEKTLQATTINESTLSQGTEDKTKQGLKPVDQMIDEISEYYASSLAINMDLGETVPFFFELHGITQAKDFYSAEKMLKDLHSVASVALRSVKNTVITFDIAVYDKGESFEKEILKYKQMQPILMTNEFEVLEESNRLNPSLEANALTPKLESDDLATSDNTSNLTNEALIKTFSYQWQSIPSTQNIEQGIPSTQ